MVIRTNKGSNMYVVINNANEQMFGLGFPSISCQRRHQFFQQDPTSKAWMVNPLVFSHNRCFGFAGSEVVVISLMKNMCVQNIVPRNLLENYWSCHLARNLSWFIFIFILPLPNTENKGFLSCSAKGGKGQGVFIDMCQATNSYSRQQDQQTQLKHT